MEGRQSSRGFACMRIRYTRVPSQTGPANSWKPYARISSGQDLCNAETRVYVRVCWLKRRQRAAGTTISHQQFSARTRANNTLLDLSTRKCTCSLSSGEMKKEESRGKIEEKGEKEKQRGRRTRVVSRNRFCVPRTIHCRLRALGR